MINQVRQRPIGGINLDSDVQDIKEGNYIYAEDIQHITDNSGKTMNVEPMLGSTEDYSFSCGQTTAQNKKVRIYTQVNATASQLAFYDANKRLIFYCSPTPSGTQQTAWLNVKSAIEANVPAGYTVSITDPYGNYYELDVELTSPKYADFYIESINTVGVILTTTTIQDSIPKNLEGLNEPIGHYTLDTELIYGATSQKYFPQQVTSSINGGQTTDIIVDLPDDTYDNQGYLIDDAEVRIVGTNIDLDGIYTIERVSSTSIKLINSSNPGSLGYASCTITFNITGMAVIGIAKKSNNTGKWTSTNILKTKRFKWNTQKQLDIRAEKDSVKRSIYITNDYDTPRVVNYKDYGGLFYSDMVFTVNGYGGQYDYDNIGEETRLVIGAINPKISVTQNQTGGGLKAGNKRYAVRFLTESKNASEWSYLSTPIPVFKASIEHDTEAQYVIGDVAGTETKKANVVTVSNINKDLFSYIELAVIEYEEEAFSGYVVGRYKLDNSSSDSFTITHTGNETGTTLLSLEELNTINKYINKARNIEILDNRLILSNYEIIYDRDLTAWAQTFEYSIERRPLRSIGMLDWLNTADDNIPLRVGEYMIPENVFDNTGYMMFETYRFAVQVKWKNGGWSKGYFSADVIIDDSVSGRKVAGVTDLSLTDNTGEYTYSYYPQFTNINLDYILSDGSRIRDLIDDFRFVRAECIAEVLYGGAIIIKDNSVDDIQEAAISATKYAAGTSDETQARFFSPDIYFEDFDIYSPAHELRGLLGFHESGDKLYFSGNPVALEGTYTSMGKTAYVTEYDGYLNGGSYQSTHYIPNSKNFLTSSAPDFANTSGNPDTYLRMAYYVRPKSGKYGDVSTTVYQTTGNNEWSNTDINTFSDSDTVGVFGGDTFTQKTFHRYKYYTAGSGSGIAFYYQSRRNFQLRPYISTAININDGVVTANSNSAGNTIPASVDIKTNPDIVASVNALYICDWTDIFGDYIYYNNGYSINNNILYYSAFDSNATELYKFENGIIWSEQKPINSLVDFYRYMPYLNSKDAESRYGAIEDMKEVNGELITIQYNKFSRWYFNSDSVLTTQDGSETVIGDAGVMNRRPQLLSQYGTRHKWGVVKGISKGGKDILYWVNSDYNKILRWGADGLIPLSDFKSIRSYLENNLNLSKNWNYPTYDFGITGIYHARFGNALITVRVSRNDAIEWNNLDLYEVGDIVYVGRKEIREGNIINFEGAHILYECIAQNFGKEPEVAVNWDDYWEKKEITNNDFYQFYTLVINEFKDVVTCFSTPKPKIYFQYYEDVLSPSAISPNVMFEHGKGDECRWYLESSNGTGVVTSSGSTITGVGTIFTTEFADFPHVSYYLVSTDGTERYKVTAINSNTSLTLEDNIGFEYTSDSFIYEKCQDNKANIEMVINIESNASKRYSAMQFNSEIAPYKLTLSTELHSTTIDRDDFESRENYHYSTIFNDEIETGNKHDDTSNLYGKWLKVKMYFKEREYNKLFNFVNSFVYKNRNVK